MDQKFKLTDPFVPGTSEPVPFSFSSSVDISVPVSFLFSGSPLTSSWSVSFPHFIPTLFSLFSSVYGLLFASRVFF